MTITRAPTTTLAPSRTKTGSDFAVLSRRINSEGLMQRRPAYYLARLSVVTLMLLGGWTGFFLIGSSWWQLLTAVFFAVTSLRSRWWHMTWHTARCSAPNAPAKSPGASPATSASG
jgi:hypothetical protein